MTKKVRYILGRVFFVLQLRLDERDADRSALAVVMVVLPKELRQQLLFIEYSAIEKMPRTQCIHNSANRVEEKYLRADGPVEEAEVSRVAQVLVYARGDELVVLLLAIRHHMGEVLTTVEHGCSAYYLADYDHDEADVGQWIEVKLESGEEDSAHEILHPASQACNSKVSALIHNEGYMTSLN